MSSELRVVQSHRTEKLLDALAQSIASGKEARDPFVKELIVVQGRGMEVWLNMELSRRFGVWANADYVYPRHLISRVFAAVLRDEAEQGPYGWERLFWTVMTELPRLIDEPEFAQLRVYLGRHSSDEQDGRKLFQLADKIADTFDEYLTYRPELLERWHKQERRRGRSRAGKDSGPPQLSLFGSATADTAEAWQRTLWRAVREKLGDGHPAIREGKFRDALSRVQRLPNLPERISVFGLSTLPPFFLRVLAAMASRTRVDLYLLSCPSRPSTERKEVTKDSGARAKKASNQGSGNRLLDAYGTLGFEFQMLLVQACAAESLALTQTQCSTEGSVSTVLSWLQQDLLLGRESRPPCDVASDQSFECHSCHSPTREVEVLHDQLLAMIHQDGVQPHEIAVMAPSIDDYAPLIDAVFGRSTDDPRFIPYRISDRHLQGDSDVFDGFLRLLSLVKSRTSSAEVLDLLTRRAVRERFEISAFDLETIRRWVVESGARWGIDRRHRARFNVPEEHANTWAFATDRLLMGYAVSVDAEDTALSILPYEEIEGKAGDLLGRFLLFNETLFRHLRVLSEPMSLPAWQSALGQALSDLFSQDEESSWQHQIILAALTEQRRWSEQAEFSRELPLEVVRELIERHFERQRSPRGFLSGGVTFCAMTPMRSIPFRVVWLLGMGDGTFPRSNYRPDFNLLDKSDEGRQPGDPHRRIDDRYLFLECLLAARERFVISFVGQSIRDNARLAPAVVVSELLDYVIERSNADDGGDRAEVRFSDLVLRHPLQPFSPRYYSEPADRSTAVERRALFSYEQSYLKAAEQLSRERSAAVPLFDVELEPVLDTDITVSDLVEFFAAPIETMLRRRLGLDLREREFDVPEREPSVLDGLELYQVGEAALSHCLAGIDEDRSLGLLRARGDLPSGAGGEFEFRRALASAKPIAERARKSQGIKVHDRLAVDIDLDDESSGRKIVLRGELLEVWSKGLVRSQFARVRAKHQLRAWIQELALSAVKPRSVNCQSRVVGRPEHGEGVVVFRYDQPDSPLEPLQALLRLYRVGQSTPLLLFPEASLAFAAEYQKTRNLSRALFRANSATAWGTELSRSAVLQRLFGKEAVLTEQGPEGWSAQPGHSFAEVSLGVFGPLLAHREEEKA